MENPKSSSKFFVGSLVTIFLLFLTVLAILTSSQNIAKNAVKANITKPDTAALKSAVDAYTADQPMDISKLSPGEQVVKQVCSRCHRSGLMRSPKLGKAKDWAPRIEKGVETLYTNAINGFNKMPARGGRASLSDKKIIAAVDHILSELE
mgnify:CR=1 FL=1